MKCCVVIDGNWLFMSRFSVMTEKFRVPCNAERAKNELKSSLMTSVQFLLEQKKFIDGVVICADGKSWRKNIPRPELQNIINPAGGYKRNRVRGEELDWKSAFAAFNDFLDELESKCNVQKFRFGDAEGDDCIWSCVRKLNQAGVSALVWSIDKDLSQLVSYDSRTGVFTGEFNKTELTLHAGADTQADETLESLFEQFMAEPNGQKDLLGQCRRSFAKVKYIRPEEVILGKIIKGDVSDNILGVFKRPSKSGSRMLGPTEKELAALTGKPAQYWIDNPVEITESMAGNANWKVFATKYAGLINDNLMTNKKLVYLNESSYPLTIAEELDSIDINVENTEAVKAIETWQNTVQNEKTGISDIMDYIGL